MTKLEGHDYCDAVSALPDGAWPCKYGHTVCALFKGGPCFDEEFITDDRFCSKCHEAPLKDPDANGVCMACAIDAAESMDPNR